MAFNRGGHNNRGGFRGRGGSGGGRGGNAGRGGNGGGRGGGGGFRRGGYGGFGDRGMTGPPSQVIPLGHFMYPCQDDIICKVDIDDVPYFNAPVYLENKEQIGKIDEIFGTIRDYSVSVKLSDNMNANSFERNLKLFIDPGKLLPISRFLTNSSQAKSKKKGVSGGTPGGRGGFSNNRNGRPSFSGGRGGGNFRGGGGGGGGFNKFRGNSNRNKMSRGRN
ncbi:probable H/ACA ribonucleoprotein complex subunit 1 [Teleopsis dalmanni]|uniref:probable H/ACA ribonucleoprotein complex subunit 1 n=1 Tax=Teleopsis dalmanni TaxID=139649 RepID=UPI0018CDEE3E|nr:probable H/ACA ribonucleoprotein complex subunit 1 [Teleopsis dalmanni]